VFNDERQTAQIKWRLIMNTIIKTNMPTATKANTAMPNISKMGKKLTLSLLSAATFGLMYMASATNALAFNSEDGFQGARSSIVDYEGQSPKLLMSRNAPGINPAQQAAMGVLSQIAPTIASSTEAAKASPKTRQQIMSERKNEFPSKNDVLGSLSTQSHQPDNYAEFGIYDASSKLFEDFDYDGYYQTFSVSFDADVYAQYSGLRALVFADLYLSRDGGPWELYFTTDAFSIIDDSSEDEFEVLTTLDVGYKTGHYDVLVDLYEVGYSDIVATISSEDIEYLYALPLESADRDEYLVVTNYAEA
jgi:hypothetical protein